MWWLWLARAYAGDCEVEDRPRMLVFPVEGDGKDDAAQLVRDVTDGLFAVDYPLMRFHTTLLAADPVVEGDALVGASDRAASALVRCAEIAVVPRITALDHQAQPPSHSIRLTVSLDLYQRDAGGRLAKTHTLVADAPSLVDSVEDVMSTARRSTVDQLAQKLPVSQKKLEHGKAALDSAIAALPADQAQQARVAVDQAQLAAVRVASVARPPVLVPGLGAGAERSSEGVRWRAVENSCYLKPPKGEDADADRRNLECTALNRARQAVRELQLETRRVPGLKLEAAAMRDGATLLAPLDASLDVKVGDGFHVLREGERVGYARVREVGDGGWGAPTRLQRVAGGAGDAAGLVVEEDPRLNIDLGGFGGVTTAKRGAQALPADPLTGEQRQLSAGTFVPTGVLRFDVSLGRTTGIYDLWQTNRIEIGFAGPLGVKGAQFGLEKRFLAARRVYALVGVTGGLTSYSLPSGVTKIDDQGEESEVNASASSFVGVGEVGVMALLSPALTLRAVGGFRAGPSVDELSWKVDDTTSGTIELAEPLSPTGPSAGLSVAWTF